MHSKWVEDNFHLESALITKERVWDNTHMFVFELSSRATATSELSDSVLPVTEQKQNEEDQH